MGRLEDAEDDLDDSFLYAAPPSAASLSAEVDAAAAPVAAEAEATPMAMDQDTPFELKPQPMDLKPAVAPKLHVQVKTEVEESAAGAPSVVQAQVDGAGAEAAANTISELRSMLETKYAEIQTIKSADAKKQKVIENWQNTFRDECKGADADPATLMDNLLLLRNVERKLQEQVRDYKKRENALLFRLSAKEQELLEMKTQLVDTREAAKGESRQANRLLLDPAVHREFMRLTREGEEARKGTVALQEELESVKYTPESKNGRRLRARLLTWQKENAELASLVSEGEVHTLKCEVDLLKDYLFNIKKTDLELLEDAEVLEMENIQLHQLLFQRGKGSSSAQGSSKERTHGDKDKPPSDSRDRDSKHNRLSPKRDRKRTRSYEIS